MKNSNPISLFSFQDIITSLTGIMIVIVLVILLQLVETAAVIVASAELQPEYTALEKQYRELVARQEELARRLAGAQTDTSPYSTLSLPELKDKLKEEKENSSLLARRLQSQEQELGKLSTELEEIQSRLDAVKTELQSLSAEEELLREEQARLAELRKQREKLESQLEMKRKTVRFEFSGFSDKTPILIECNQWGFRAREYPDGTLMTFGNTGGSAQEQIGGLIRWLAGQDLSTRYPVLLFRAEAIPLQKEILQGLFSLDNSMQIGQEPLGPEEEVFQ